MFTHSEIWAAIDHLAERNGLSTSGLARRAGLDATAFNRSKRVAPSGKARWPSTESLAKVLDAMDVSFEDFGHIAKHRRRRVTTIRLIGLAQAGSAGYFDDSGFPVGGGWDDIAMPGAVDRKPGMYALEIAGESMAPAYRAGDKVLVDPNAPARRGDRVVVKTTDGEVMAKELGRHTEREVELISLNPQHGDRVIGRGQVEWIARIMWVTQ